MQRQSEALWLGIDCGGSWLKAGLYDRFAHEVAITRQPLALITPQAGWAERDMQQLWCCCMDTVTQLITDNQIDSRQIKGVGISAQGKGLFLLDKQGQPLGNAILSSDRRALQIVSDWTQQQIPEQLYPFTRQTLWTGHPVSLLRWLKQHDPVRYQQIGCVMMTHDYLRWRFTGQTACEESNISESNLYNMVYGSWDARLAQMLDIAEIIDCLPGIVGSAEICGYISADVAAISGLTAGTPVVGGLFDVVATALCAGLHDETVLNAVMGTWAVTSGITQGLRQHEALPYVYGRYIKPDYYIIHEASPTSSANLEWLCTQWGGMTFADINQQVAALPKVASDILFMPFLYGSNAGLKMTSGFYGLQSLHQRGHLLQAVYEGVIFSHMTHLQRMRQRFHKVSSLRVTGGPTNSSVWMQMLADVSGLPVSLPQVTETGCLGAAIAAQVGTEVWPDFDTAQRQLPPMGKTLWPDTTVSGIYQRKYQYYQLLLEAIQGFHMRCATLEPFIKE